MTSVMVRLDDVTNRTVDRIAQHPFVIELMDGTLPEDAFVRYISQNYLYLAAYARALASIAARSSDAETIAFFARRASYTIDSEQAFATDLIRASGLEPSVFRAARQTPSCLGYSSFIKQAAVLEPIPVALAAMLPCYSVYNGIARRLVEAGSPEPRYQRWIEMYVDESFQEGTIGVQRSLARASEGCGEARIERMVKHARIASRYEWLFWESAYKGLDWPEDS